MIGLVVNLMNVGDWVKTKIKKESIPVGAEGQIASFSKEYGYTVYFCTSNGFILTCIAGYNRRGPSVSRKVEN